MNSKVSFAVAAILGGVSCAAPALAQVATDTAAPADTSADVGLS